MSRIRTTFARLQGEGEAALIPYLTVGYPSLEETHALVEALAGAGADLIELGVPFSDPMADGPTIQEASRIALEGGVTLRKCLSVVAGLRNAGLSIPIVLMGYCNPFLRHGLEELARDAAQAGVDGFIVPDLPPELATRWVEAFRPYGLELIFFLSPTTTENRIQSVVQHGSGFIYCISVAGVTGARSELPADLSQFLARARANTNLPLGVGFGISTPEHVRQVAGMADAAIVGSALLNVIRQAETAEARLAAVRAFIQPLKAATRAVPLAERS